MSRRSRIPALFCALVATRSSAARDPQEPPAQAALEGALREAARAACPGRTVLVDAALSRAAQAYIAAVVEGRAPQAGSALQFFASLETSEPAPVVGIATVRPPADADRAVGDLLSPACRYDRAGVAAGTSLSGEGLVAVLTAQHVADLAPIAAQVEPGASITVDCRLGPGLKDPRLFILNPGGDVETPPPDPAQAGSGHLSARVRLAERGEHTIEVLAEGAGGPEVVAIRRVFVGVAPPTSPPARTASAGSGLDAVQAAIAQLRAAHGLPALERDPALDAVASGHSREMARTRTFAHVLASDGTLTNRLSRANYGYQSAGENIGLAESAALAHEAVALSPAHVANLLDPRHRRLGLAAVAGLSPEGGSAVYLTEVLAAPILRAKDPAAEVWRALAEERRRRGLPALERDAKLDALAQRQVERTVEQGGPPAGHDLAERALAEGELTSAAADFLVGSAPDEAVRTRNAGDTAWLKAGVGATYASSRAHGPGRLWVIVVYGR